jgi:flagellar biogenesis protein FliO
MMESMYVSVIKMLLAVAVIVGVGALFYRYRDRLSKLNLATAARKGRGLQKTETIHLGYRKFVSVLEIKDRTLVVGVGDKEISLLAQWKNEEKLQ